MAPTNATSPVVRRRPRAGDLGAIIAHHGRVYAAEYGLNSTFEAEVAASVSDAGRRGWPSRNEASWIVELGGEHAGSLALTDEGDGLAAVRWFLIDPFLRGRGLGRSLVTELVERARGAGYERLRLVTFSELRSAARIYRSVGFELRSAETGPRWGRERLTYQHYELSFQARAQSSSSPSTGSSARPFSVSA
jgi:ribosomal protein S18 acetylase RimI-like enzyme